MGDHVIIQVRDDVISRLKTAVPDVSNRVYRPDEAPQPGEVDDSRVPYLMVRVGDDSDEMMGVNGASGTDPQILEAINLVLYVYCAVKQDGDAEKAAYNLRRDVESAFLATADGLSLGGKVQNVSRVAGANNRDDAIDQGAYSAALQFQIQIVHLQGQPDSFTY